MSEPHIVENQKCRKQDLLYASDPLMTAVCATVILFEPLDASFKRPLTVEQMSLVTKECGRLSSLRRAESEQIAEPSIGIEAVTDILIQSTSIPIRETLVAPASPPTTPVRVASTSVIFVS
ncbi:hypothetical protein Ciccas_008265 [Cichlidogyrus casuarinus]|uniref:Uncharacterized protein n=1 Tax=Cichlidogyrus casuarinus TaxID=1844966 RepID=A0ABD2Q321_9PLAT